MISGGFQPPFYFGGSFTPTYLATTPKEDLIPKLKTIRKNLKIYK